MALFPPAGRQAPPPGEEADVARYSSSFLPGLERFAALSVADSGTRSDEIHIGYSETRADAWTVALKTTLAAKDRVLGRLGVSPYMQSAGIGHQYDAWDVNRGGLIFVPYPRIKLSFVSALSPTVPANHTLNVSALPWRGGAIIGSTSLYGRSTVSLAASGTTNTTVPDGATHYYVAPQSGLTAKVTVTEYATPSGGSEVEWDSWQLDPTAAVAAHGDAPASWRLVPPAVATTAIRMVNGDGVNARKLTIHWRYDLAGVL